jgi:hypothetical protein
MAIATKRAATSGGSPSRKSLVHPNPLLRALDAIYRFFASLKLAVISIASLAAVLAVGTFIERNYGTVAVQEWVYKSVGFALLLAFLATNILCAALIRFPWTRRQTGFVITHAGLLLVLAGSMWSFQRGDEGQVALAEGSKTDEMIRPDHPVIRIREVDPHTGKPLTEGAPFDQWPFRPGPLPWPEGRYEVLTPTSAPYHLAVKTHLPASAPRYVHEKVANGTPMIRLALMIKQPGALRARDVFANDTSDGLRWLVADHRFHRAAKTIGAANIAFQYLDSDEKLDAFLHPPQEIGPEGVAQVRYTDNAGKKRLETIPIDENAKGKVRTLPESDVSVEFDGISEMPLGRDISEGLAPDGVLRFVLFKVRKGSGEPVTHYGWNSLPMLPSVLPPSVHGGSGNGEELVHIDYLRPVGGSQMGAVEVAGLADGRLFYRSFNRKGLKASGPLPLDEEVTALGGGGMAMSFGLKVDQYLPSGRERLTYEHIDLDVGQLNNAIPAALVELSCDGETHEKWLRRSGGYEPHYQFVTFSSGRGFEIAYDVDRKRLGFEIQLDDFEVGLDPGSMDPASYRSDVRLTDEAEGIKDKPIGIWMNHTMTHRGWTFYQSSYIPIKDPATDENTGRYMSVLQVGYDPGRPFKYAGCVLVVLGAVVQFYMRSGIFWWMRSEGKGTESAKKGAETQGAGASEAL